jgi:dTDP-4-dehydrorhamnose reductase
MKTVAILGASGMLGSTVFRYFEHDRSLKLIATVRNDQTAATMSALFKHVDWRVFDVQTASVSQIAETLQGAEWIINNIGVIKPYIHDNNPEEIEQAILINSLFPCRLSEAARLNQASVLQIATDCVYSGRRGNYGESDPHDALDVYGKSKSLGETQVPSIHHLRCSIIGPEEKSFLSLLEWFRRQPQNASLNGFTNHHWNGVTTLHFAKICLGIIANNVSLTTLQHIVPSDIVTKAELLKIFAKNCRRSDLKIRDIAADSKSDRTLKTEHEALHQSLWSAATYPTPPSISQMVQEMVEFEESTQRSVS